MKPDDEDPRFDGDGNAMKRGGTWFHGPVRTQGDFIAGVKVVHQAAPRLTPPIWQLPMAPDTFVGREAELSAMDAALHAAGDRSSVTVVEIHGMAGVGKTSLAVQWAHRTAGSFPGGQIFLDLQGPSAQRALAPSRMLFWLLQGLGMATVDIPADEVPRAALYRSLLADRKVLVVLDNAASAEQIMPLLPGGSGCLVVVTSRTHLEGLVARYGAISVPVHPLSFEDSRELAAHLLGAERSEAEPQAAAELAESCARLPLAIRIAAAGLATGPFESVAELVEELTGAKLDTLAIDGDSSLAIRSAFDVSYENLDTQQRRAFRMLSLIPGPHFGVESVAALLDLPVPAARRLAHRLVRKHLVEQRTPGRLRLHELLGEYAAERLAIEDCGESDAAVRRLQNWYLTSARTAAAALGEQPPRPASHLDVPAALAPAGGIEACLAWFDAERAGLVATTRQATRMGEWALALGLADALFPFLRRGKHNSDNIEIHELGLTAARSAGDRWSEALMLDHLAVVRCDLGRYAEASQDAQAAYQIFTALGECRRAGWALNTMSRVERSRSRYDKALEHGNKALQIFTAAADRHGVAEGLEKIAQVYWRLSRYRVALRYARESLRIHRTLSNGPGEADALETVSRALRRLGRCAPALRYAERALAVRERIGDRRGQGEALDVLSRVLRRTGRSADALRCAGDALRIREDVGDLGGMAMSLCSRAHILRKLGDYPAALLSAFEALRICQEISDEHREGESLATIATIQHDSGKYDEAIGHARRALVIRRRIGDRYGVASTLNIIAMVERRLGRHADARRDAEHARTLQDRMNDRYGLGESLNNLAEIERSAGEYAAALAHARAALEIRRKSGDRFGVGESQGTIARIQCRTGDHRHAMENARTALRRQRDIGDRSGQGVTLDVLAQIHIRRAEYREATEHVEESLWIRRETGDRRGIAESTAMMALILWHQGSYDKARARAEEALAIQREIGDRHGEGDCLNTMARLMRRTGDLDRAHDYARQALAVREKIGDRRGTADTLDSISRVHGQAGDHEQARDHALGALDIQSAIGDEWGRGLSLLQLGKVHLALSRRDTAREYFAQAVTACGRTGNREGAEEARQCLDSMANRVPHLAAAGPPPRSGPTGRCREQRR